MRGFRPLFAGCVPIVVGFLLIGCATCPTVRECSVKRYGQVLRVKPESFEEYKRYHADVWPEVLDMIRQCNIRNYSIFHKDGYLFAYFEYVGDDFDADMAKMAADPKTQEWWDIMMPMQQPLETRAEGEWWANMERVFHCD
jgi:L-rhamnose mutarotase